VRLTPQRTDVGAVTLVVDDELQPAATRRLHATDNQRSGEDIDCPTTGNIRAVSRLA
jgi:hypothetical protein